MADSKTKPGASTNDVQDPGRRDFIVVATYAMGGTGCCCCGLATY
jgi:hypothetical protein